MQNLPQGLGSKWAKFYTKLKCGQKPPLFLGGQVHRALVIICAFISFLKNNKKENKNEYICTYTYVFICVCVCMYFPPISEIIVFQPETLQELI